MDIATALNKHCSTVKYITNRLYTSNRAKPIALILCLLRTRNYIICNIKRVFIVPKRMITTVKFEKPNTELPNPAESSVSFLQSVIVVTHLIALLCDDVNILAMDAFNSLLYRAIRTRKLQRGHTGNFKGLQS